MDVVAARIAPLDGLRGLAVMGIVLMNVAAFALPGAAYGNPLALGAASPLDLAVWTIEFVLVDGKMRAIFSALFGASLLVLVVRADRAGRDPAAVHLNRMAWLLLIGLAHFYLLWSGDILSLYAMVGTAAFLWRDRPAGALLAAAIALIAIQLMIDGAVLALTADLHARAIAPGAPRKAIEAWRAIENEIGRPDRAELARQIALHRGAWSDLVRHRIDALTLLPLQNLIFTGPETLGFMLLGMAGLGSGFLTGGWDRARYRRWMIAGYAIGVPPAIGLAAIDHAAGFDTLTVFGVGLVGGAITRPFIAAGHVALALLWLTARQSALRSRIGAAGRAALSNYLGTSLVMTWLFCGHGLGLFGRLGRAELILVVLASWLAMLAWSRPWLARFSYGPAEWAWRSLARRKIQPMRLTNVIARHYQ